MVRLKNLSESHHTAISQGCGNGTVSPLRQKARRVTAVHLTIQLLIRWEMRQLMPGPPVSAGEWTQTNNNQGRKLPAVLREVREGASGTRSLTQVGVSMQPLVLPCPPPPPVSSDLAPGSRSHVACSFLTSTPLSSDLTSYTQILWAFPFLSGEVDSGLPALQPELVPQRRQSKLCSPSPLVSWECGVISTMFPPNFCVLRTLK